MKAQKILLTLLLVSLITFPLVSFAQVEKIEKVINNIVTTLTILLLTVCTLMVFYGGFVILLSQGSPDKVGSGKQIILWAAIGYVIAALANAIALIVKGALN